MPDWKSLVRARLGSLPVDPAREADIVDELAQHAAEHYAELMANGATEADAIRTALAPLSDPQRVAADIARADRPRQIAPEPPAAGGSIAGALIREIRYAVRLLMRAPAFAAV